MLVFTLSASNVAAQSLEGVTEEECVYGDCDSGRGTLVLKTQWGPGEYVGNFKDGEFHGYGRLEIPISFLDKEIYVGNLAYGVSEDELREFFAEFGNSRRYTNHSCILFGHLCNFSFIMFILNCKLFLMIIFCVLMQCSR